MLLLIMVNNYHLYYRECWLLAGLLMLLLSMANASTEPLLLRLRSDHAAMVSAEHDFRSRRERGVLGGTEATDYAAYVAELYRRVAEDCVALADMKIAIPDDLTCPERPVEFVAPAAIDQAAEQTDAEAAALLDAELSAGLGEFDEMLLREQERVKAATPHADSGAGTGSGDTGGAGSDGGSYTADAGHTGASTDSQTTHGQGAGPGSPQSAGKSSAPPGTPSGSDDDVVARQLREAAEKETDPELKKKLWEEYRKYKQGTF
jgi:hypothetical protein